MESFFRGSVTVISRPSLLPQIYLNDPLPKTFLSEKRHQIDSRNARYNVCRYLNPGEMVARYGNWSPSWSNRVWLTRRKSSPNECPCVARDNDRTVSMVPRISGGPPGGGSNTRLYPRCIDSHVPLFPSTLHHEKLLVVFCKQLFIIEIDRTTRK